MDCKYKKEGITACEIIGIVISIIVAIAVGILFSAGLIPVALNLITISLIMSVVSLGILLFSLYTANIIRGYNGFYKCVCNFARFVLTGSIGTFLATTISLTIGLAEITIASTIFVAISSFFLVLMIVALICLLSCFINETCRREKEDC